MPSLSELKLELDRRIANGEGEERGALFLPKVEAAARVKNEKKRTRFQWNTDSPEFYSRLNEQKDRYINVITNKVVAIEVFISVLQSRSDDDLRELAKGETNEPDAA